MNYLVEAIKQLAPNLHFRMENYDLNTLESLNDEKLPSIKDIEAKAKSLEANAIKDAEAKVLARAALLERLGITEEEAALLLG